MADASRKNDLISGRSGKQDAIIYPFSLNGSYIISG
jgi:hypothetical protein